MTIATALKSLTAYPVPAETIEAICSTRGVDPNAEADTTDLLSFGFLLAKADVYLWLAMAPNISQGGQSYSISEEQRKHYRTTAFTIMQEADEPDKQAVVYGYKGSRL